MKNSGAELFICRFIDQQMRGVYAYISDHQIHKGALSTFQCGDIVQSSGSLQKSP